MLLLSSSTNVFQGNLDSFLVIAEDLKFQGLMGQMEDVQNKTETFYKKEKSKLKGEQIQLNFEPKIEKRSTECKYEKWKSDDQPTDRGWFWRHLCV